MTAINVILLNDSVTLVTDTKASGLDGRSFNVSKVAQIPHMQLAVATRGKITALDTVARLIAAHAFSYESARAYLASQFSILGVGDVEVFLAGWSEAGPAACFISTVNSGGKIFDIAPLGVAVTPIVDQALYERFATDPIATMPDLLAAQHRGNSSVGGFVNVTTVRAETIQTYTAGMINELAWRAPLAA